MSEVLFMACAAESYSALSFASACATPFKNATIPRRTAVPLSGSYVAFNPRTGSCINDARLGPAGLWNLLSAGESLEGTAELAASEAANRREDTPPFLGALLARTSVQPDLSGLPFAGLITRRPTLPTETPQLPPPS